MHYQKNSKGFTLIELIVVVLIIALLSTLGLSFYARYQDQAKATKIANDFRALKKAWKTWKAVNPAYINEDTYGTTDTGLPLGCSTTGAQDEPVMSSTPIITSPVKYLENTLRDPWEREYAYDYDSDTWTATTTSGGVNVMIHWCNATEQARYAALIPIIDKLIDNGDGNAATGQFYWTGTTTGEMWFRVADDGFN